MTPARAFETVNDLLSYALAMEEEAVARYGELAEIMESQGNPEVADFFRQMAANEAKHVERVQRLQSNAASAKRWDDIGGREAPDWGEFHYRHTPHHAISVAIRFERAAANFFHEVAITAPVGEMRAVAREMAREEIAHMRELEAMLARQPPPPPDWDFDPDPPGEAQ
jgi:rubrerythrin